MQIERSRLNVRQLGQHAPILGERCYVDSRATVIGDVVLGRDVSVWPGAVIRGDLEPIKIGERSNVQDNAVLHTSQQSPLHAACPLIVGSEVIIGHSAVLHGCSIADNVLIGISAVILDNAVVQSQVIVAAGSIVPPGKLLQSGFVYAGNPCKPIREITDKERVFLTWSPQKYIELKDKYLGGL